MAQGVRPLSVMFSRGHQAEPPLLHFQSGSLIAAWDEASPISSLKIPELLSLLMLMDVHDTLKFNKTSCKSVIFALVFYFF